ncbi:MAG: 23S rRNA pseudouridine synthase F, partial [Lachnospiraceae bacterium]|nr:23S rRNA pseudouridine synthase F [Lachnospiraceae bacterium]
MGRHSKEFFDNGERKEEERINKFIADAGICSRRAADEFIENGRVKINGEVAVNGSKVKQGDVVTLDGRVIEKDTHLVLIALNKPEGIVCTSDKTEP